VNYSPELVEFVKAWEGLKLRASGDPLVPGVKDIGYGHKLMPGSTLLELTPGEAEAMLRIDLDERLHFLDPHIHVALEQHEQDALLSLAFNVGTDAVIKSTLLHRVNHNRFEEAADEFPKWCKAGGKIVQGLKRRRLAERAMFIDADYSGRP
jgi:lysozyme